MFSVDYTKFLCVNSQKFSNQKIRYIKQEDKTALLEQTHFLPSDTSLLIRLSFLRDGYSENNLPKCKHCGTILLKLYNGKFLQYCSSKCYSKTNEFIENLKKVDHDKANNKRRETMISKYGVEFNSQRSDIKAILGKHCSTDEFKIKAHERGCEQYSYIDREKFSPDIIAQMNETKSVPEIANIIGSSPSFVLQSLNKIGLHGKTHSSSFEENKIKNLLIEHGIEFISNSRSVIPPYELDIYIPSKNLAIEVNGIYWHSELNGKDKNYHLNKTVACRNIGITLLHFWDIEVKTKFDILASIILSSCGIYKSRIFARKCVVVDNIDVKTEQQFFENNHLQSYIQSSKRVGLIYDNELVSCMSFGKPRYNKKYDLELLRFCSKINVQVIGGASRLFSYKPFGSIITYADMRYSTGDIYNKLNLEKIGETNPSYRYFKNDELFSRVKFQKHKLNSVLENFDEFKTEWENMKNNGYDRIWDCGNSVFVTI